MYMEQIPTTGPLVTPVVLMSCVLFIYITSVFIGLIDEYIFVMIIAHQFVLFTIVCGNFQLNLDV